MNTKKTILKILFVAMWVVIGGGMLTLLIAAMGKQKRNTCKDYIITIKGIKQENFLGKADIMKLLKSTAKGNIKGQKKASFNLQQMENHLEKNEWIKDAQLYFDNKDVLHISVVEREPVARIFNMGGKSFYIDETEHTMQLSDKVSRKAPVFTGFPDKKIKSKKDSLLLHDIRVIAEFINNNSFWTSQVAQIDMSPSDIDASWEFEMVPLIGNHIVKLGSGENIEQKFNRLFIFYKQVLARSGFDKYKIIDVRYAGQVVGGRSENPKVDSVQLRKNVENLLLQIKKIESENEVIEKSITQNNAMVDPTNDKTINMNQPVSDNPYPNPSEEYHNNPIPRLARSSGQAVEEKQIPKAVMKVSRE